MKNTSNLKSPVEDGSIDRKACRKLSWDFKKKYSFRIGAFRRDFLD